jgi:hypothetical protein
VTWTRTDWSAVDRRIAEVERGIAEVFAWGRLASFRALLVDLALEHFAGGAR